MNGGDSSEERTRATTLGLTGTAVQNVCVSHLCDKQTGARRSHEELVVFSAPQRLVPTDCLKGQNPPEKGVFHTVAAHDSRCHDAQVAVEVDESDARSLVHDRGTISLPALSAGDDIECGVVQEPPHPPNVGLPDDDMVVIAKEDQVGVHSVKQEIATDTDRVT